MSIAQVFRPLALALTLLAGAAMAAFPQENEEANDPPGRVGRISHMDGTVSFRNADGEQWVPATLNFPLTSGDALWTEPKSRAEIQIGSTDLRLDQMTAIQIAQLDDAATRIRVDQGSINLRLREVPPGGVRILTPHATVVMNDPGRYHVDVAAPQGGEPSDHTRVAVLEGAARIEGLAAPLTVSAGHSATMRAGDAHPMLAQAIALPLDTWALERERLLMPSQTLQYVSPEMTGVHELDNYGQWVSEPIYGAVWYPRAMTADWAPYRSGHWAYVRPWGWTWIDHQPWGFAPFHYGRWVRIRDRWGWHPGHRAHRPIYAPALVVFASGGTTVLLASGRRSPAVGWAPLGPHEHYRPHHRHSPRYGRDVNIAHVAVAQAQSATITEIGRNAHRDSGRGLRDREGLTVVAAASFTGAAAVDKARVTLRDNDWTDARHAESLDHLRPSRSARAGVMVPTAASANDNITASNAPRQDIRRGERNNDRTAPPTIVRPALTSASVPARDPDVLPQAPGPNRNRQRSDTTPPTARQDREPVVTPLNRAGQANNGRAAPALRTPDSITAAPPALRAVEPPRVAPRGGVTTLPPGRGSAAPIDPSARVTNPSLNGRESRDDARARREPAEIRMNAPRDEPRSATPAPQPRQIAPSQSPGSAPHTVAPARPAIIQAVPPSIQPNRRDGTRLESQPNAERHRVEPRAAAQPPVLPRTSAPSQDSPSTLQRSYRPDSAAPQRIAPPQPRREEREIRREPMRQDSPAIGAPAVPQQAVRPASPPPQRPMAPQNAERRAPQAAQQSPSRPQQNDNASRRQESTDQNRKRPQDRTGNRGN